MSDDPLANLTAYELRHLLAHLFAADRPKEMHRILALERDGDEGVRQNAWYVARVGRGDFEGFLGDLSMATHAAEIGEATGLELRYSLEAVSIRSLASNVPSRVLQGLVRHESCRGTKLLLEHVRCPNLNNEPSR